MKKITNEWEYFTIRETVRILMRILDPYEYNETLVEMAKMVEQYEIEHYEIEQGE